MSDYQDGNCRSSQDSRTTKLSICLFCTQQDLGDSVARLLNGDRYKLKCLSVVGDFEKFIQQNYEEIDCLILARCDRSNAITDWLWQSTILLPTIIVQVESTSDKPTNTHSTISLRDLTRTIVYHQAELHLYPTQLIDIELYINLAIGKFINLRLDASQELKRSDRDKILVAQQLKLTKKITAKLGHSGVGYRRDPHNFYANLSSPKQEELYQILSSSYRQIVIDYFSKDYRIDKLIDEFADRAFFANISTSQIIEIHMELIDDFSQQLKLQGRSNDVLLDYRLPLIDVISHLCEIYRRSISGKDFSLEQLFAVE
jgi:circadian clock protein KaiA